MVEHEYPKARLQDRERLRPILQGSIAFVRHIDEAAACMSALQHEVLAGQGIPIQGVGRQAYRYLPDGDWGTGGLGDWGTEFLQSLSPKSLVPKSPLLRRAGDF